MKVSEDPDCWKLKHEHMFHVHGAGTRWKHLISGNTGNNHVLATIIMGICQQITVMYRGNIRDTIQSHTTKFANCNVVIVTHFMLS